MNREQAIEYLCELGLDAKPRDWSMGKTIVIPMGDITHHENGISMYPGVMYLAPVDPNDETGPWAIEAGHGRFEEIWPSLKEATKRAPDYIAWWTDGIEARHRATDYYIALTRAKREDQGRGVYVCVRCGRESDSPCRCST